MREDRDLKSTKPEMGRAPCCDKANVKKGPWSPEEDSQLKHYIETYGTGGNWISLPQKAGLRRCGKSCRLRWLNYLRPNIKHGEFSAEEDRIICTLFATIGSRWSIIAAQLPNRTDNDIKNYWNTKLKKKLMGMVSSSPNTISPQIIKKTQSLSPISHQNASFNEPLSNNNILNLNPIPQPLSYSSTTSSIPYFNCCNTMNNGCLVTNPFDQCCYETLKTNQIQMGFEFGSGLITSSNGFEENHHKLMNNNNINGHGNYGENAIMDYDGMLLLNMEMEEQKKKKKIKREVEEKYCYYY